MLGKFSSSVVLQFCSASRTLSKNLWIPFIPREHDQKQNIYTVPWWERNEWEKIYKHRQWSERFKQCTKNKYGIDIGPLLREKTIAETDLNTKKRKYSKTFFGHSDPKQNIT